MDYDRYEWDNKLFVDTLDDYYRVRYGIDYVLFLYRCVPK